MGGVRPYPKVTCKPSRPRTFPSDGAWRSLVARLLWEQEVAGSNPAAPMTAIRRWPEGFGELVRPGATRRAARSGSLRVSERPRTHGRERTERPSPQPPQKRSSRQAAAVFGGAGVGRIVPLHGKEQPGGTLGTSRFAPRTLRQPSTAMKNETSVFTRAWGVGE